MCYDDVEFQNFVKNIKMILRYTILKANEYSLGMLNRGVIVHIQKNHFCVTWKKKRKDALLNGIDEIERNFTYVKINVNKKK